mmetsp:Transcript_12909/g.27187  ORF Transcript_12909/g.27187 Transcript_12909/m.27187 type:complete len:215 (+) Transcript_12909:179-823(+)
MELTFSVLHCLGQTIFHSIRMQRIFRPKDSWNGICSVISIKVMLLINSNTVKTRGTIQVATQWRNGAFMTFTIAKWKAPWGWGSTARRGTAISTTTTDIGGLNLLRRGLIDIILSLDGTKINGTMVPLQPRQKVWNGMTCRQSSETPLSKSVSSRSCGMVYPSLNGTCQCFRQVMAHQTFQAMPEVKARLKLPPIRQLLAPRSRLARARCIKQA